MKDSLFTSIMKANPQLPAHEKPVGDSYAKDYLINEAQSLLSRLRQVKPFSMTMPMVPGAAVSARAM